MSSDIVQLAAFSAAIFGAFFGTIGVCDFIAHTVKKPRRTPPPTPVAPKSVMRQPAPPPIRPQPRPAEPDPLRLVKKWAKKQEEKEKEPPRLAVVKKEIPPDPPDPIEALTKLRNSCLSLFQKKPLKNIPPIFIEDDDHFSKPIILAHYHTSKDAVCFRKGYLETATAQSLADTMKHELLHAWIQQHDFKGDRAHDDLFKATAHLLGINWWEGLREY